MFRIWDETVTYPKTDNPASLALISRQQRDGFCSAKNEIKIGVPDTRRAAT